MSTVSDLAAAAAAAVDAGRVVQLTRDLVRIKSVFEPETGGNETAAAAFVLSELRALGLAPVLEEVVPGRPNVICDWSGSGFVPGVHRTLMLEGHTDVVTEGDASSWQYPPFEAVLADGKIHGRGSVDMKGGVAAAITALEAVMAVAPELAGRVRLGILADEEGMMLGVKHFVRQGWADDVDGAIVCEPEENEICLFQKGALRFDVHFRGVMSHGAMPYAGVNPITALTAFVEQVMRYQAAEQQRLGAHEYLGLPWFTPTILEAPVGGTPQINVMPETARVTLDVRTIPGQDHDGITGRLKDFASDLEQRTQHLTVTVNCIESRPWTETDAADPLVQAVERAYRQVLGEPRYGGVPGATDGTFLHAWANVPVVTIGPGDRTLPHQRDEFIRVDELVAATRLYAAAIIQFLAA